MPETQDHLTRVRDDMRAKILADIDAICSIYRTVGAAMFDEVRSRLAGRVLHGMEPILESHARLLAAAKNATRLYDDFALGTLEAAAKYGPDYEPPSDAYCLKVRGDLQDAIDFAEPKP